MSTSQEEKVWSGTPSQLTNLASFIFLGLFFWLVIPLLVIIWKWLVVKCTNYELSTERLITRTGVINRNTDELELYRIRDYRLEQPLFLRIFSLGNIILETSDRSHPSVVIRAVPNAEKLREDLRKYSEQCRARKRVREIDLA